MKTEKMKTGIIAIFVSFALTILLAGCKSKQESEKIQYVKTAVAESAGESSNISYPGKTKSADEVNVSFRVSGPISSIYVKEGDRVSKGQVIATMDPRDYQTQLSATEAEYQGVKADAERIIAMYKEGNTTASNYDKARFGLEQITQKLSNHRNQLADTKLVSPISGYVKQVLHEGGETVSAGMPIVSMFGSNTVEVEINVSAFDYINRDRLNNVSCTFDVLPGEEYPLTVKSISPEANASQLYTVRLGFKDKYDTEKITPGMSAMVYVNFSKDSVNTNVNIPATAILNENDRTTVFVYDCKTGTVKNREVIVDQLHTDGTAEISFGLQEGETIVSAGVHSITDGQKVKPLPKPSKTNIGGLL